MNNLESIIIRPWTQSDYDAARMVHGGHRANLLRPVFWGMDCDAHVEAWKAHIRCERECADAFYY